MRQNPIRRRAPRDVQHHALGEQKSFYECWLSVAELQTLLEPMRQCILRGEGAAPTTRCPPFVGALHFVGPQAQANPLPTQWSAP
ncbi:MAG: hypothetical protein CFE38_14280 [Comamonadaceae bacterium PBBC1]|nr:MAG: hypothetical protein CFE38_14280 [Comamonadaceae bacterium PBBC1]